MLILLLMLAGFKVASSTGTITVGNDGSDHVQSNSLCRLKYPNLVAGTEDGACDYDFSTYTYG